MNNEVRMKENGDFEVVGSGDRWARITNGDFCLPGRTLLVLTEEGVRLPLKTKDQIDPTDTRIFTLKAWGVKGYA